jgi:hypothetical protein
MSKSTQMIEWLKDSKYANKTPINHMFWVNPKESYSREQSIGDLCCEIESQLWKEINNTDSSKVQDWYIWKNFSGLEVKPYVFTQMPPLEKVKLHNESYCEEILSRIKQLLPSYTKVKEKHFGQILPTDGILSWSHRGTGLQWMSFNYLHSSHENYADVLNKLCYAGYSDWRIPTISEIRFMLSADKDISEHSQHPLLGSLPTAMPLPIEQTPDIHPSSECLKGYYVFDKETTVTTGTRYNRDDDRIEDGGSYNGRFITVRGQMELHRGFQTGWAGTLLAWTEKNMTVLEQGQLPGSSYKWKQLEHISIRGKHLKNESYIAAFAAMKYLDNLKKFNLIIDEFWQEIPKPLYKLSQIKNLNIRSSNTGMTEHKKWSITSISSDIENMTNLENIDFSWQKDLTRVPDELFELPNLTTLSFGGCWNLVLSKKQVKRVCELAESGINITIPPLYLCKKADRVLLLRAIEESGDEINWPKIKSISNVK